MSRTWNYLIRVVSLSFFSFWYMSVMVQDYFLLDYLYSHVTNYFLSRFWDFQLFLKWARISSLQVKYEPKMTKLGRSQTILFFNTILLNCSLMHTIVHSLMHIIPGIRKPLSWKNTHKEALGRQTDTNEVVTYTLESRHKAVSVDEIVKKTMGITIYLSWSQVDLTRNLKNLVAIWEILFNKNTCVVEK